MVVRHRLDREDEVDVPKTKSRRHTPRWQNGGVDVHAVVKELEVQLRAAGRPDRAENEKRYLKSALEHWGTPLPEIRRVLKGAMNLKAIERAELVGLVEALWARPIHELRTSAVELLCKRQIVLDGDDLPLLERMLREAKTWAYVDALAVHVAGPLLARHPAEDSELDRWATDDDFWLRRSALLVHLGPLRTGGGDWERFTRYADAMMEEKEFFIRKAIGWILRDTARKRPALVYEWILPRAGRASGVTIREVVKPLSPDQADRVMTAYRGAKR